MRSYLATLHKKPDHHKKRFAFLVSGTFTMFIFVSWALVNFGLPTNSTLAVRDDSSVEVRRDVVDAPTPFGSMKDGVAAAFKALGGGFGELKQGVEQVNIDTEYKDMRTRAFENYGR